MILLKDFSPTFSTANTFTPISSSIKELTNRIPTSIVSAIPPFIETVVTNGFNIHTDTTCIVKAEEATESPIKHVNHPVIQESPDSIPIDELQRKLEIYNKIGEEEFEDTILFKHTRRKKQSGDMAASVTSLSSASSDEKEFNVTHPTLMNISAVGILPDRRSPDTILSEIEQKEKLLAEVLNFDKVRANIRENCFPESANSSTRVNGASPEGSKLESKSAVESNLKKIEFDLKKNESNSKEIESNSKKVETNSMKVRDRGDQQKGGEKSVLGSNKSERDNSRGDADLKSSNAVSPNSKDIRVLAQAYPYFCNSGDAKGSVSTVLKSERNKSAQPVAASVVVEVPGMISSFLFCMRVKNLGNFILHVSKFYIARQEHKILV